MQKKETRGGARAGAGRKFTEITTVRSFRVSATALAICEKYYGRDLNALVNSHIKELAQIANRTEKAPVIQSVEEVAPVDQKSFNRLKEVIELAYLLKDRKGHAMKAKFIGEPSLGYVPETLYVLSVAFIGESTKVRIITIDRKGPQPCEYGSVGAFLRNWANVEPI